MPRSDRVAQAIKRHVSTIIHDELKDPRLGFVTITRVDLTPDLRFAKIFFSVLGGQEDYLRSKRALSSALGFIRSLIARRIDLRFAPEIMFREDHSAEYSVRIQKVLDEIKSLEASPASAPAVSRPVAKKAQRIRKKNEPEKKRRVHKKK